MFKIPAELPRDFNGALNDLTDLGQRLFETLPGELSSEDVPNVAD